MYKENEVFLKLGTRVIGNLDTTKRLLQSCSICLMLFKIYLENTLKTWKRKCEGLGILVGNEYLYTLCFADDQLVIAQEPDDLSYMMKKLLEEYTKQASRLIS